MPAWVPPLVLAPFVGSFLGVLIRRLPAQRPIAFDRSACETCGRTLSFWDLVPIGSFLALRGRCRHCGEAIAPFHLYVELAAIAIAVWSALVVTDPLLLSADCMLGWMLLTLAWIDWLHFRLPDVLTLPLIVIGLAVTGATQPDSLGNHALAAIVGYASFRLIGVMYRAVRGIEGLGQGDAKLFAAAGAWLGLSSLPWVVLIGAALGLLVGLIAAVRQRRWNSRLAVPFGSSLAVAIWLVRTYADWFATHNLPSIFAVS